MSAKLAIYELFDQLEQRIDIRWIAGRAAADKQLDVNRARANGTGLVGHLNLIHSNQIQIIGWREMEYLVDLDPKSRNNKVEQLFTGQTKILILADGVDPLDAMAEKCNETPVALFCSALRSDELLAEIQFLLAQELAEQVVLHGVFLEVAGMGLLLTGAPGTGKSELALELVTQGHRLIADDAPVFSRISPTTLSGSCPEILLDFLEVRGLGVLNVRAMFGDSAIKPRKYLRMIVNLVPLSDVHLDEGSRLDGLCSEREILGIKVPEVTLPVAPGRNIAVLVETAARNQLLKTNGYFAAEDFRTRVRNQIKSDQK